MAWSMQTMELFSVGVCVDRCPPTHSPEGRMPVVPARHTVPNWARSPRSRRAFSLCLQQPAQGHPCTPGLDHPDAVGDKRLFCRRQALRLRKIVSHQRCTLS